MSSASFCSRGLKVGRLEAFRKRLDNSPQGKLRASIMFLLWNFPKKNCAFFLYHFIPKKFPPQLQIIEYPYIYKLCILENAINFTSDTYTFVVYRLILQQQISKVLLYSSSSAQYIFIINKVIQVFICFIHIH